MSDTSIIYRSARGYELLMRALYGLRARSTLIDSEDPEELDARRQTNLLTSRWRETKSGPPTRFEGALTTLSPYP